MTVTSPTHQPQVNVVGLSRTSTFMRAVRSAPSVLALVAAASLILSSQALGVRSSYDACTIVPRSAWVSTFGPGKFVQSLTDKSACDYWVSDRAGVSLDLTFNGTPIASARAGARRVAGATFRELPSLGHGAFINYGHKRGQQFFLLVATLGKWDITVVGNSFHQRPLPQIVSFAKQVRAVVSTSSVR